MALPRLQLLGFLQPLAVHPRTDRHFGDPVLERRDAAQIFLHVLFGDVADRHRFSLRVGDGHAEEALGEEDALGVVAKGAVAKVGDKALGLVEPLVDGQVFFRLFLPTSGRSIRRA